MSHNKLAVLARKAVSTVARVVSCSGERREIRSPKVTLLAVAEGLTGFDKASSTQLDVSGDGSGGVEKSVVSELLSELLSGLDSRESWGSCILSSKTRELKGNT